MKTYDDVTEVVKSVTQRDVYYKSCARVLIILYYYAELLFQFQ